jgi:hypothetical protein
MREGTVRRRWLWTGAVAILVLGLAYAWIDGGREPVHQITQSLPLPEHFE